MVGTVRYHPGCWSNQVAEIRAAIERGERDIAEGRVVSHKEVMRKLRRFRKD
jgi:predicted transcriptional regulator